MSKSLEALEVIECILSNHQTMLEAKDKRFEFINIIKKDLERKEELEKENQILKQSVKDTYDTSQEIIAVLKDEKQKLKKALDKACERLDWDCPVSQDLIADLDCENRCRECWKIYFLKEVLGE